MIKKTLFLSAVLLTCLGLVRVQGQSLTPTVLAVGGDYFVNASGNAALSFTIGEMALVQTYSTPTYHLTNGFQQPSFELVGIQETEFVELFEVYPNPASDYLHVRYDLRFPGLLQLQLFSMNGVEVMPVYLDRYSSGLREEAFDLQGIAQGMYFLRVSYQAPGRGIDHISHYKINVINP
jgi:Secretion system C-terminal sorting domain